MKMRKDLLITIITGFLFISENLIIIKLCLVKIL